MFKIFRKCYENYLFLDIDLDNNPKILEYGMPTTFHLGFQTVPVFLAVLTLCAVSMNIACFFALFTGRNSEQLLSIIY